MSIKNIAKARVYRFQRGIQQIVDGIKVSGTVARDAGFDLERYESVLGAIIARTRLG